MNLTDRYPDGITTVDQAAYFLLSTGVKRIERLDDDKFRLTSGIADGEMVVTTSTEGLVDLAQQTFARHLESEQRRDEEIAARVAKREQLDAEERAIDRIESSFLFVAGAIVVIAAGLLHSAGAPLTSALGIAMGVLVFLGLADALWGHRLATWLHERMRRSE